ncbi:MAG TPA: outer membrane beta-barrel protein [Candidatus Polarisedimenticolia bacterium]|nr:outer membrane beta-barrel protein [Candidatus Polarisedimenticolia bacterium]
MTRTLKAFLWLAVAVAVPSAALAQSGQGDISVSGNLGFANAFDEDFDGLEAFFNGTFEFHTSDEIAWRGMLGRAKFDGRVDDVGGEVKVILVNANIVRYWEGDVTPFLTGGVGLYNRDHDGPFFLDDDGDLEFGINGGGGVDFPLEDGWAIKVEGLFHGITGDEPDVFFTATGGVKYTF